MLHVVSLGVLQAATTRQVLNREGLISGVAQEEAYKLQAGVQAKDNSPPGGKASTR